MNKLYRFFVAGTIGFIVDAIVLLLLVYLFHINIILARILAFFVAVFITWLINRNFTFSQKSKYKKKKEYFYYLIIQSIGAILNISIFIVLINSFKIFEEYIILPLAIASIIVMFFNFFTIKKKIYNQ